MNNHTLPITWPKVGKYVLAVSGGADSMALLDLLARSDRGYELIVAHYDHAMRLDSAADESFVARAASNYGLRYYFERSGESITSEDKARRARYEFLKCVCVETDAEAIITAHHRDDLVETSLLNLARGTGRRGLAPMQAGEIVRPLMNVDRAELRRYAVEHRLKWREDVTNTDELNPRNFLRHSLLPLASGGWRGEYLDLLNELAGLNEQIDGGLSRLIHRTDGSLTFDRSLARTLSIDELSELIVYVTRATDPATELSDRLVSELTHFVRTGLAGKQRPVNDSISIVLERDVVRCLRRSDRSN